MRFETLALDCLYVNWALPAASAPKLPESLRYELHGSPEAPRVFASALLFKLSSLRLRSAPFLGLSYPQMNLRLYVLDDEDTPSVLFLRMLVPPWVVLLSRLFGRQPANAARLDYPEPSWSPEADSWSWSVRQGRTLKLTARRAEPGAGPGMRSWRKTVSYFRERPRGYVLHHRRLRCLSTAHPSVEVWPLEVDVGECGLLCESLPDSPEADWSSPHSAWLCPNIPFVFELGTSFRLPLPIPGVPAAAGRC